MDTLLVDRLEHIYRETPELEGERGQIGLVRASGASKSVVNQWLTGKIKSIDIRYALNIEQALGFSHIWLMTGQGHPRASENFFGLNGARPVKIVERLDTVPIKRMKFKLRAGVDRSETEMFPDDGATLDIPRDWIDQHMIDPDNLVALQVRGQSMEPMLFEDDTVVVDLSDKRPVSRELYALEFEGDACIKQLLFRGGQWYLHSLNPDFKPVNVRSGQLHIIGRVVYQPGRVITGRL